MALQYLLAPTFQFVNTAGKPLSGGAYMEVYVHGTRTKYFCASDFNGTLHPFRIPLDSLGSNIVLANDTGSYDVYAYNRYGTLMMSRYNVKPGAGGGIGGTITSTDGSIDIHPTEDGVDLSVNGLDPSCLKVSADPRTTDGKFHFDTLVQEGDQAYVDNEGAIRLIKGWYHFTANVQLAWNAGARNETHQVTLYTTLSNSVIDFDISHVHTETIELSGDVSIAQDGAELVIGVSGMPTGLEASVIGMDVHAITGKDGHDKYYAGDGITISDENYIAADLDVVQEKLVAGQGVTIEGNVISAPSLVQVNSDWNATSGVSEILNKPDLDVFATKTEVNTGLAGKQNTIPDLAAIRSGATAGSSAVQPSDLAAVATTGDYNSLNNRPNLTVYATKTEVNTGLATKQDTISDLSAIRAGAQAGSTAVQPAALDSYATKVELNTGLSGKQDTINDLSTIRSGASAGASAVQPSDLAPVATSGDYDDLSDKPDLSVYATTSAMNTALAGKQDTISDLSTIRSGAAAGATAIQPGDLATVATTGSYDDLSDKPTIPAAQVNSDWNSVSGVSQILNKPSLAAVATTGDYDDLVNKPSIPAAQVNADWNASSGVAEILNKPANLVQDATYVHTDENFTSAEKTKLSGIAAGAEVNVQADWTESDSSSDAYIANKPALATVATTGAYSDLTGTPTIPTVSDNVAKLQYGVATYAQVVAAFNAGKSIYLYNGDTDDGVVSSDITFGDDGAEIIFSRHNAYGAAGSRTEYKVTSSNVWSTTTKSVAVPTVDQSYSSSSANAQSGIAVAQAIAAIPSSSYTAGTGIDITNNVVSVDNTVVAMKSDLPTATSDLTNDSGFITLSDVPAQVNADWNSSSGASEILNKPTIPSGTQLVPAATSADADKVLTVDAQGTPAWASAQAPISAGDGVEITNNVVSAKVDGTTVTFNASGELQAAAAVTVDQTYNAASTNAQSGTAVAQAVATKEDVFDVGTGLEMDTSGSTPTLQVEAPVDIVAGPGIVVDNPDGNTLRVSVDQAIETVLWENASGAAPSEFPVTLSEATTNFETIRFYFRPWSSNACVVEKMGDQTVFMLESNWVGSTASSVPYSFLDILTVSGTQLSFTRGTFNMWSQNTLTEDTSQFRLFKVVGVHRIAGGN